MQLQFLDHSHAIYFQHHHQTADDQWYEWIHLAQQQLNHHNFKKAQYFLGCCFDLAKVMIESDSHFSNSKLNPFEKLAVSGHGLAECLKHLNNKSRERHILLATHYTLMQTLREHEHTAHLLQQPIEISCYMLKRHYCFYHEYSQISDVLDADMLYLSSGLVH